MNKKVQLNDMELNQVAGGGWTEFWQKVKEIFTPGSLIPTFPHDPVPVVPRPMPIRPFDD